MALINVVGRLSAADKQQLNRIEAAITKISAALNLITAEENTTNMTLADLKTQVDKNSSVEESAVTLIQGLATQLQAAIASNDPAAVQALADELSKSGTDLATAITANTTPAPPTTTPTPGGTTTGS